MKKYIILALTLLGMCQFGTAQQSSWKTDNQGWVLRKEPGKKDYKRFFAMGLWNAPGYNVQAMETPGEEYRTSLMKYLNSTDVYNMVYTNPGNNPDNKKRVEIAGSIPFYNTLLAYQKSLFDISQTPYWQYKARRIMKNDPNNKKFVAALDNVIDSVIKKQGSVDHVWAPIDEIVQGGAGADWTWYPVIGEKIKERIKLKEPNTLIYTDLVGLSKGNYWLFEKNYLLTHDCMPADEPPFEALGPDAKIHQKRPTLGFSQGYDGRPVYINGTDYYTEFDETALKDLFYNNLKICSNDYKNCGDVFGINSFNDCNQYPALAGTVVDGLKAGLGNETPVWIFFDGNGYGQPANESTDVFVQNIKCQMYTSIIHGATGVMFWNDRSKPADVFNGIEGVMQEMEKNVPIFMMETDRIEILNNLHFMVKKDGNKRYLIATNTSKKDTLNLEVGNFKSKLKPMEVLVASFSN